MADFDFGGSSVLLSPFQEGVGRNHASLVGEPHLNYRLPSASRSRGLDPEAATPDGIE